VLRGGWHTNLLVALKAKKRLFLAAEDLAVIFVPLCEHILWLQPNGLHWAIPGFCDILSRFASFSLTSTPILP